MATKLCEGYTLRRQYRIVAKIGEGGEGSVYSAHDPNQGNQLVAIKQVLFEKHSRADFKEEANIMRDLDHQNVVKMLAAFKNKYCGYIVMELAVADLTQFKLKCQGKSFTKNCIMSVMYSICSGLAYLHDVKKIIFADLKSANVLVMPNGDVKLSDFGCAQRMNDDGKPKNPKCSGTAAFMAPELAAFKPYLRRQYNAKVDIFSFGSTVMEMLLGITPNKKVFDINGINQFHFVQRALELLRPQKDFFEILEDEIKISELKIDDEAMELVKKCLSKKSKDRPTAEYCCGFLKEKFSLEIELGAEEITDIAKGISEESEGNELDDVRSNGSALNISAASLVPKSPGNSSRPLFHCALKIFLVWSATIILWVSLFAEEIFCYVDVLEFFKSVNQWLVILVKYFMLVLFGLLGLCIFWKW